uniref:Uncharacterized protein n=1 Tax=Ditylenchus dipsaci TaxID=166011 RepID=A0A915DMC3_9BILA
MMKASQEEHRKTVVEQIKTTGSILGAGLQDFLTDRTKMVATVGGLTALAIGWYSAKRGTSLGAKYIEARLGKPSLVRETSRLSFFEMFKHPINSVKQVFKRNEDPLKGVVLNPSLESRLRDVAITTKNTKRNLGLFRNVLFYGPPGTGKTMFAKSLARHSGLDYAIMTGGALYLISYLPMYLRKVMLRQWDKKGSAIHKIFDWAETSRKGGIRFARRLERERILLQYFNQYIAEPATSGAKKQRLKLADFDWIQKMKEIAARTKGMSGRELSKLVVGWQASAYASEMVVSRELARCGTNDYIEAGSSPLHELKTETITEQRIMGDNA